MMGGAGASIADIGRGMPSGLGGGPNGGRKPLPPAAAAIGPRTGGGRPRKGEGP